MILLKAVYPRWRGEHTIVRFNNNDRSGLSPLARGTLPAGAAYRALCRFIPAGAGNTQKACTTSTVKTVYPRWRGEHKKTSVRLLYPIGLSPLARGTPPLPDSDQAGARFIPAGAGNMLFATQHGNKPPVYPRWRGEHLRQRAALRLIRGLSPLARGTHGWPGWLRCRKRFIPAGAGNTTISCGRAYAKSVYPRWRGEHLLGRKSLPPVFGLSPLARGTPKWWRS